MPPRRCGVLQASEARSLYMSLRGRGRERVAPPGVTCLPVVTRARACEPNEEAGERGAGLRALQGVRGNAGWCPACPAKKTTCAHSRSQGVQAAERRGAARRAGVADSLPEAGSR